MLSWTSLRRPYPPLRAAASYVGTVAAVNVTLVLVLVLALAVFKIVVPSIIDVFILMFSVLVCAAFSIILFGFSLFLIFAPFYSLYKISARLRVHYGLYFVLSGSLTGAFLIAGLLAGGSIISVSGSAFWRAPHWMWVVFSAAGGLSGLFFWRVSVRPQRAARPH